MSTPVRHSDLGQAVDTLIRLTVDELRCYRIGDDGRLSSASPDQLTRERANSSKELWVDIQAARPDDFRQLLERLPLHPLIVEDCLDPHRSSRFSSFDGSLHFEFPVFAANSIDHYVSVICVPGLLITVRTTHVPEIDHLLADLDTQVPLNEGTRSSLLYTILDTLGDCVLHAARDSRLQIRRLSQAMDADSNAVAIEEIISVKRDLQDIATIAEDQLYCVRALAAVDSTALPMSNQREYLRDAVSNYETALRVLHRYEARATELHQQYNLSLQARTEARIRILTILSAICMPLTLIAGIYGMNFARMPELRSSWGYPMTIAAMLVIALGQLFFFYRRGWFR